MNVEQTNQLTGSDAPGEHHEPAARGDQGWYLQVGAALIIAAGALIYSNSFRCRFVFDDRRSIVNNQRIRQLWPVWEVLKPPRPLVNLSLAVNYRLGRLNPWGYHAFNLAVHLAAALVLLGVVRRTLLSERLRGRFGPAAVPLAVAAAAIWMAHPLQTQSVTYTVQRAESMMGLFYLLTLYAVIRGAGSPRPWPWYAAAVVACATGMAAKEVMVTAPIVVLLYDRVFIARSLREVFRRRWALYAPLAATWGLLAWLAATMPETQSAGFSMPYLTPFRYAATQFGVVLHYLRLSFWPHPLCLDYAWPPVEAVGQVLPHAVALAAILAATALALWKSPALGFLGAWFFLILAPTSSIMPIVDLAFEHRMYLSLAAVVVLAVVGAHQVGGYLLRRLGAGPRVPLAVGVIAAAGLVAVLGTLSFRRNRDYLNDVTIWGATAAIAPNNVRAHVNLGAALRWTGHLEKAIEQYRQALRIAPDSPSAHFNLGNALMQKDSFDEAILHYTETARIRPRHPETRYRLGVALAKTRRYAEAVEHLRLAVEIRPNHAPAQYELGLALSKTGRHHQAIPHYTQALRINPGHAEAHYNLGNALVDTGQLDEAMGHYRQAVRLKPDFALAHYGVGLVLGMQNRSAQAIGPLREAIRLGLKSAPAHYNLGVALAEQGNVQEAIRHFATAVRIDPSFTQARAALAKHLDAPGGPRPGP